MKQTQRLRRVKGRTVASPLLQLSAVNLSAKVFEDPGVSRSVFSAVPSDRGASSLEGVGVGVWNESGEVRSGGDEGVPPRDFARLNELIPRSACNQNSKSTPRFTFRHKSSCHLYVLSSSCDIFFLFTSDSRTTPEVRHICLLFLLLVSFLKNQSSRFEDTT